MNHQGGETKDPRILFRTIVYSLKKHTTHLPRFISTPAGQVRQNYDKSQQPLIRNIENNSVRGTTSRSAKPLCVGSIPTRASNLFLQLLVWLVVSTELTFRPGWASIGQNWPIFAPGQGGTGNLVEAGGLVSSFPATRPGESHRRRGSWSCTDLDQEEEEGDRHPPNHAE
jgi:hypothetical protein